MLRIMEALGLPIWAGVILVAVLSAGGGAWIARGYYTGQIAKIELAHAEDRHRALMEGRARQIKSDAATRDVQADYHVSNVRIIRQTQIIKEEIPIYVQDDATCVTVGLVRVLDAAALATNPNTLDLLPGESNEACAGIGSHALAKSVVTNYGRYWEVADQLEKLQRWVDEQIGIQGQGLASGS